MKKNIFAKLAILALSSLTLFSCVNNKSSASDSASATATSSETPMVDYVSQAKLTIDYTGKTFLDNGIGQVKLVEKVDGDTAHFKQVSGSTLTIKGRYLCIDTPESTGMIEPWGHKASNFNGEKLLNAKTIVLSSQAETAGGTYTGPSLDSTGSRYLVYVWVSTKENAASSDLELVNLSLVQAGLSKAKGAEKTDYAELFRKAAAQAQAKDLYVWSDAVDPEVPVGDHKVTLKQIIDGVDAEGNAFDWTDSKATFTATVVMTGPDNGAAFLNKDFTWDENGTTHTLRYGIYVFTQYIVFDPLVTIGNELEVTGIVSDYKGVKQLVGVSYSAYYPEDDDMKILSTGNKIDPLTGTAAVLGVDANINVVVKAEGLKCTGGYATQNAATKTAYSFTLYCEDSTAKLNIYIADTIAISDGKYRVTTVDFFQNATSLTITGGLVTYTTTAGVKTYQIKLCRAADLVVNS
jgi:endonuclease YncB( thermonuclease family)